LKDCKLILKSIHINQFNPDFPLGRRMSASGFSRQFCANFEGNSGAIDAKIGAKMTEKQPRSTAQAQSAA
jgi:hypothetical protein